MASLQALLLAGEAGGGDGAAAADQHHTLGQPWHPLRGGAGAAGLSTQQWHAVQPYGFHCLAARVLSSPSPGTTPSLVHPGLSQEAAAAWICLCPLTQGTCWREERANGLSTSGDAQEMSLQDCPQGPAVSLLGWLKGRGDTGVHSSA